MLLFDNLRSLLTSSKFSEEPTNKHLKYFKTKRVDLIRLVNRLVHKLKFRSQTFYLAVNFLDSIAQKACDLRYEIVAVSALILAAKYDENDTSVPGLHYFKGLVDNLYISTDELTRGELECLKSLDYNLDRITPYHFINFFLTQGVIFSDEMIGEEKKESGLFRNNSSTSNSSESSENQRMLNSKDVAKIGEISKECLLHFLEGKYYNNLDESYYSHSALEVACACISLAREIIVGKEAWHERLASIYKIKFIHFSDCFDLVKK
jgi:hypothetical protein